MTIAWTDQGTYHRATISGTGTVTLSDLYDYLYGLNSDERYMTKTGSAGAYTYTWVLQAGEITNQVYINSGSIFELEDGDTWNHVWSSSSSTLWTLHMASSAATIKIGKNVKIDGNSNSATYARGYWGGYGRLEVNATTGNESEVTHFRSCILYNGDTDPHDVNYLKITDTTYSGGYLLALYGMETTIYGTNNAAHSFKNITISDVHGWGYFYFRWNNAYKYILEDWTIDNLQNTYFYFLNTVFKNSTFKNQDDYTRHYSSGFELEISNYNASQTNMLGSTRQQNMLVYDTCTFDAQDAGVYNTYVQEGGTILFKNCTHKNATYGLVCNRSIVLLYGTQTYDSITTHKYWSSYGVFLHVRKLTLTVTDPDGNALEDALVSIVQKEGKETHQFKTDSNGNIKSTDGAWIYLAEKEETSNGVYTQWSDGSTDDKKHQIVVTHQDYGKIEKDVAMTEDKDITLQLPRYDATSITNATIANSEIN